MQNVSGRCKYTVRILSLHEKYEISRLFYINLTYFLLFGVFDEMRLAKNVIFW